ncbi:hypothetical protein CPC08DRAFT_750561 [Agrocybe pediades]|nr:hypothetical protein CPC08DRAFT_750561 [Agrocybe pediades]
MASSSSSRSTGKILKRANPSTIQDKFLVGYQGWFTCAGDGEPVGPGHHGWLHWFNYPIPDGGRPNTDVWPDVSAYSPSELFPAPGLKSKTGEPVFLFSSRNAKTVQRHFRWMAEHGVDGAFLQRFAGQCDLEQGNEGIMRIRDEVGDRVREAAEREGRVYAIMYDVSGVAADRIQRVLERDWVHLIRKKGILDSPNYLREKGKPVIALWGFGFDNAGHTPQVVRSIIQFFRNTTPGGVYIMGGSPAHWRTAQGDADSDPGFLDVWLNDFDAISPWTIGRYGNEHDADKFYEEKMKGDFDVIKRNNEEKGKKVDYIPVVFPGGSGYNLSEGKWGFNDIKRNGGRFLWKQIFNAKRLGVRTMYGAMWDEYDEGTAFMPIVENKRLLPESDKFRFMALDEDGYDVPCDWYMRICGFAAEGLRSERMIHETFPVKELQDYYSSRPRYEEVDVSRKEGEFISGSVMGAASGSGRSGEGASSSGGNGNDNGGGQTYEEWLAGQKEEKEELPPPPYTLEAEEAASSAPGPTPSGPTDAARQSSVPSLSVAAAVPPPVVAGQGQFQNQPIHDGRPSHPTSPIQVSYGAASNAPARESNNTHSATQAGHVSGLSQPQQTYPPSSAYGPPPTIQHHPPPPTQQHQDPVSTLTYDFNRQTLSSPPPQSGADLGRRASATATTPGVYPPAGNVAQQQSGGYPSRPTSGQSNYSQGHYPPQHQQGQASLAPRPSFSNRPASYQNQPASPGHQQTPSQWPPPEWGVRPSSTGPPPPPRPAGSPPNATNSHSTYPANSTGGANLSRPQSFTASSMGGSTGGANLRPSSSLHARPNQPPASSSYNTPTPISPTTASPYATYGNTSTSSYAPPPPRPTSSQSHAHHANYGQSPTHASFPSAAAPQPPAMSSYTHQPPSMSTYPGSSSSSQPGSSYNPAYSSAPAPWGGAPHASPPHSPMLFPGQSSSVAEGYDAYSPYGYNTSGHHGSTTFPPAPAAAPSPPLAHNMMPSSEGVYFPQAVGGDGSSYFPAGGGGAGGFGMPGADPYGGGSQYPGAPSATPYGGGSSYPGSTSSSSYAYPQAHPATPPGGPGAWVPNTGGSAPSLPPRPPVHASLASPGSTSSSSGYLGSSGNSSSVGGGRISSSALGLALSAVDKVAGKKTREQLESQVGNLAQTGSKLFGKYMK